jgi:hypothetical protein
MPLTRAMVQVRDDSPLGEHAVKRELGAMHGLVEVGAHRGLMVCGSAAALRRLGCALLRAADLADRAALPVAPSQPAAAIGARAVSHVT